MSTKYWGNLNQKQIQDIIDGAGTKVTYEFSWVKLLGFFPIPQIRKYKWVFGGVCGLCGHWNWQWRTKDNIFKATGPCKNCENNSPF